MAAVRQPLDILADKRVQWGGIKGDADIVVLGVDWSTGTFKMDLRPEPGDSGTPLVTLANAAAGAQGISATYDAGYLHPVTSAVVGATVIRPQINETTLEALALAADPARAVPAHYDVHATVTMGKFVLVYGTFSIKPGVTI